ncbi:MAG: DUF2269 family protein [Dehalococcoidia bacterium]|nr:DUF2269 family protein [Dehalococcoidia bacterium]
MILVLRAIHMLSLFWMMWGLGAVMSPVWRAWNEPDLQTRALLLSEATRSERMWLLPGLIATGLSGFAWTAAADWNPVTTGWLVALELIFGLDVFIFVPLLGVGLRRVHLLALQAAKQGEMTDALRDALADNVPLVFGTLLALSVPVQLALAVFKPF